MTFCLCCGPSGAGASYQEVTYLHRDLAACSEGVLRARDPPEPVLWTKIAQPRGTAPHPCKFESDRGSKEDPGWGQHRTPWLYILKLLMGGKKYPWSRRNYFYSFRVCLVCLVTSRKWIPSCCFPCFLTYLFCLCVLSASEGSLWSKAFWWWNKWKITKSDLDGLDVAHSNKGMCLRLLLCPTQLFLGRLVDFNL